MSIAQLFIIAAFAFLVGQLKKGRRLTLLGVSAFMIYWLQSAQDQITLTFWLPTATLLITTLAWLLTSTPEVRGWQQNLPAMAVLLGVILFVDLNRHFQMESILIVETPRPQWIISILVCFMAVALLLARWKEFPPGFFVLAAAGLMLLFILIKMPAAL